MKSKLMNVDVTLQTLMFLRLRLRLEIKTTAFNHVHFHAPPSSNQSSAGIRNPESIY